QPRARLCSLPAPQFSYATPNGFVGNPSCSIHRSYSPTAIALRFRRGPDPPPPLCQMRRACGIFLSYDCLSPLHIARLSLLFIVRKLFLLVALVSSDNVRAVGVVFPARVAFAVACAQAVQHGRVPPACAIRSAIVSFALTSLSLVRRRRAGPPCTFASLRAQLVWPY